MNRHLLLEVALNELNHLSKKLKYYTGITCEEPKRATIIAEDGNFTDIIAYFDEIKSFTIEENFILLNEYDGSTLKLDENEVEWVNN